MDCAFWLDRWQQHQIGFHQSEVNRILKKYWAQLKLTPGAQVFVPLCGKSRDMEWLCEQGHPVLGVELSPIAVEECFSESGLKPVLSSVSDFQIVSAGQLQIYCGDIFNLTVGQLKSVRGVYDRASLIALPDLLRERYAKHLIKVLPRGSSILLITLEYPAGELQGPPFSVDEEELTRLFGRHYDIKQLSKNSTLDENPHFREKGVTQLTESVYHLSTRS